eukprot:3842841-Prymnesium_polylepis.1
MTATAANGDNRYKADRRYGYRGDGSNRRYDEYPYRVDGSIRRYDEDDDGRRIDGRSDRRDSYDP